MIIERSISFVLNTYRVIYDSGGLFHRLNSPAKFALAYCMESLELILAFGDCNAVRKRITRLSYQLACVFAMYTTRRSFPRLRESRAIDSFKRGK